MKTIMKTKFTNLKTPFTRKHNYVFWRYITFRHYFTKYYYIILLVYILFLIISQCQTFAVLYCDDGPNTLNDSNLEAVQVETNEDS